MNAGLFTTLIQALAWPLLILFALLFWRRHISGLMFALIALIGRIDSAKVKGGGVDIEVHVIKAETVRALPPPPDGET